MDKIDDIRKLGRSGASGSSIARDTGVSEPTARKCLREPDLSERPPSSGGPPSRPCPGRSRGWWTRGCSRTGAAGTSSATPRRASAAAFWPRLNLTPRALYLRWASACSYASVWPPTSKSRRQGPRLFREWFRLGRGVSYRFPLLLFACAFSNMYAFASHFLW